VCRDAAGCARDSSRPWYARRRPWRSLLNGRSVMRPARKPSKMSCNQCDELTAPRLIRSPGELARTIRVLHASVLDGTVELVEVPDIASEGQVFNFPDGGPSREFVRYRLKCCACQLAFELSLCGTPSRWAGPVDAA
jgi:hypothetical protein